jgi:hypothetical protein
MPLLVKASVVLFLAAEVLVVAAIGSDALFVAGAWAVVAGVTVVVALLVHGAAVRIALAALLVAGCVLFAVELGLFFLPAAAVLLAAAVSDQQHHHHHGLLHGRG